MSKVEAPEPGPFSERRCGLDHLSFAVPDRATLDAWVPSSAVKATSFITGAVQKTMNSEVAALAEVKQHLEATDQ
jgi:hypothetical protein